MTSRYISSVDCAKLIREALKARFPDTKFAVRTQRYSGGSSIDVTWTDGPSLREVQEVTRRFEGETFDGMIDMASIQEQIHPDTGERVVYGNSYVFCRREYTDDFWLYVYHSIYGTEQRGVSYERRGDIANLSRRGYYDLVGVTNLEYDKFYRILAETPAPRKGG